MAIGTSFTAQQHFEHVEYVLSLYGKTIDANVAAIIPHNCETMKCLSNLCSLPLVRCASHRYDLAVTKYIEKYEPRLKKFSTMMIKLKSSLKRVSKPEVSNNSTVMDCIPTARESSIFGEIHQSMQKLNSVTLQRENTDISDIKIYQNDISDII